MGMDDHRIDQKKESRDIKADPRMRSWKHMKIQTYKCDECKEIIIGDEAFIEAHKASHRLPMQSSPDRARQWAEKWEKNIRLAKGKWDEPNDNQQRSNSHPNV